MTKPTPSLDPRVFSPGAGERTAAIATAAIGACLLFAAAGIFIALKWETMGLAGKASVVGLLAASALAGGQWLKRSAPGVAAVLVHLGAFLVPIDVGGVATSLGMSKPQVGFVAGAVGVAVLTALDRPRSRFMAVGRVLSFGGAAIGAGAMLDVPPALLLAALATAATLRFFKTERSETDALGLSLLAASGPVFTFASSFATDGSLITWLASRTELSSLQTTLVAALTVTLALATNRRWPGMLVAGAISAISVPGSITIVGDFTGQTIVFLATTVVVGRLGVDGLNRAGWQHYLDGFAGAVTVMLSLLAVDRIGPGLDWPVLGAGALLGFSWLLSDIETGRRVDPGSVWYLRLWQGASGPVSTVGLATAAMLSATGADRPLTAAGVLMATSALLGLSERRHATSIARIGFPLATLFTLGAPYHALVFGLGSALLLQARATLDLLDGRSPRLAAATQFGGLIGLGVLIARFTAAAVDEPIAVNLVAASLITTILVVLALAADRLPVPDLRPNPRLMLAAALLPLVGELSIAGVWALLLAGLLFVDVLLHRQTISEMLSAVLVVTGTWMLGVGESIAATEMYAIGPALVLLWFGCRTMREGMSSWLGIAPAVALLGGSAVFERVALGAGWHSILAGVIGLAALGVGVERKWGGSAVIGAAILATIVFIEVSAVVPRLPVWMLLATGGVVLLATGLVLERRAGLGSTATLRATWAQFH